jgi:superfamily I DNA/RNA helicase/RecB family exonuclease
MASHSTSLLGAPPRKCAVVLGAPGSGKTTLLIERMVSLHRAGVSADGLLILTPTRVIASRVRDQVGVALGVTTAGPRARSLQAFAFALVAEHHRERGLPEPELIKARLLDADIQALLEGHLEDGSGPAWPEPLGDLARTSPRFRTELREWLARASEHDLSLERIRELASKHTRPEWVAAAEFGEELRTVLASARPGAYTSAEIIRRAEGIVREGLPKSWRDLVHIGVDDAHDLTVAGLEFLDALRVAGLGVTVTGEPDVSGSTFRGSEPSALSHLQSRWGIQPIVLDTVYRHGADIRAVVQNMTERIGTAGAGLQRQAPGAAVTGQVESLVAPSFSREAADIARIILDAHHDDGVPWDRIAVIARRGARVSSLTSSLAAHGVPARTAMAGMTLIDEPAARALVDMVALGRGVLPLTSATAVNALAGVYGGMTQQELRALRFALRVAADPEEPYQPADQMIADALHHRGGFALVPDVVSRKAQRVATILDDIRSAPEDSPVVDLLWKVWDRSPAATQWAEAVHGAGANPPAERALDAVVALFRQAADFVENQPGANPELFLDALLGAEIPDDVLIPEPAWPSVVVSTPPGVAGREFDLVIVAGLEEGLWPDLRPRESLLGAHHMVHAHRGVPGEILDERRAVLDDELRVFVLALSRATTRIVVTVTHDEESGPSPLFSLVDRQATRLESSEDQPASIPGVVGGLRRKLQQALERGEDGKPYAHDLALLHERGLRGAHPESWWGLLAPSTEQALYPEGPIPVSPSAIDTLEKSPLEWFLGSIARHDPTPQRGLGSLIHSALEEHPSGTADTLWSSVDERFAELDHEAGWIEQFQRRRARRMVEALAEYLRDHEAEGWSVAATEQRFQLTHGRARVTGYIDRIELTPEGQVMVVDLKTGSTRTESQVVEDPQLLAYQWAVASGALAEVAPEGSGSAGASLLFVTEGVRGKSYRLTTQPPVDEQGLADFLTRVEQAAQLMAAHEFAGEPLSFGPAGTPSRHRWHFVGQVCGDA